MSNTMRVDIKRNKATFRVNLEDLYNNVKVMHKAKYSNVKSERQSCCELGARS